MIAIHTVIIRLRIKIYMYVIDMSSSINEIINKIYYDPKTGYIGTNALLLKV